MSIAQAGSAPAPGALPASPAETVVSLCDVRKTFGDFVALEKLSLDMRKGELLCLLGPSGCGKTTTLRIIAGFLEADSGHVFINGHDVTALPPYKRDTGMVFQSYALFPHMTVAANVAFGLENLGIPRAERNRQVDDVLTLVELNNLTHRYPRELSGGQQQRVALARALALRPAVLLLDEPFSNLDAQLRTRLREELRRLIDRVNITTLFVTHDQEEALMLSDRIAVMNRGRIEQISTPENIYERPATRFVAEFIGRCSILEGRANGGHFVSKAGLRLPIDAAPGDVTLIIRPEYIDVASPAVTGIVADARVIATSYFGALTRIQLSVEGESLMMEKHFSAGRRPKVGDAMQVVVDPKGIRVIPVSAY